MLSGSSLCILLFLILFKVVLSFSSSTKFCKNNFSLSWVERFIVVLCVTRSRISFNYKFETENEFLKKCLLKCKLQAILTMQDCRVLLSQIGSMFNIPELYGAFAFPSLCIDPVAWPFK